MFLYPDIFVSGADREDHYCGGSNIPHTYKINKGANPNLSLDFSLTDIDGYVPKNQKLFTYPFNYILCSNNSGANVIYKYEDFYRYDDDDDKVFMTPSFTIKACITPRRFNSYDT